MGAPRQTATRRHSRCRSPLYRGLDNPCTMYFARKDGFTDRRAGTVRRLTPVKVSGETDSTRPVLFSGQTQLLTPAGVLPLVFEIEAATLQEALQKFPEGVKVALEQAIAEARE